MNKDIGININDTISRIREMSRQRSIQIHTPRAHEQILKSLDEKQALGRQFRVIKGRDTGPQVLHFDLNSISMVSDPEPNCVIKDKLFAFDYAMEILK